MSKNRVARYVGDGEVLIALEESPTCPTGGLLVETLACGLCSGELMGWYMDRKIPHVLGHEVSGRVMESEDERFPVGSLVFPHHHAPCLHCEFCMSGRFVHCAQWRRTKLIPGGMADRFAVSAENLNDTLRVDDLRPIDSALIEPLACVMKSIRLAGAGERFAIVGLGVMGLMHLLIVRDRAVGYDLNPARVQWASNLGLQARPNSDSAKANVVFVCPGSQAAFNFAMEIVEPEGTIVMFAPLGPSETLSVSQSAYFRDVNIRNSYSCGPNDTALALEAIRDQKVLAEQVISHFIGMDELPAAYGAMKRGEILKPMVVFK